MGIVRVCPERDAVCPHGIACPFAADKYACAAGWDGPPLPPREPPAAEIARLRAELSAMQRERDAAVLSAAVEEYRLRHPNEEANELLGRAAAIRGMMVRLGLYDKFNEALELATWPSPTRDAALEEPRHD